MIELKRVNKYYNYKKKTENHVLKDISISLPTKGLVSIVGESGSGKTTLLGLLSGHLKFEEGDIKYFDTNSTINNRPYIGYIYQDFLLLNQLSVMDNLKLQLRALCFHEYENIDNILMLMDIGNLKYRVVESLSGGEKQKVAIARALLINPSIIIADEPTGNLDPNATVIVMKLLSSIAREKLVILVTHDIDSSYKYSNRIYKLENGCLNLYKEKDCLLNYELLLKENSDNFEKEFSKSKTKNNNIFKNLLQCDIALKYLIIILGIIFSLLLGFFLESTSANPMDFASMPKDYYYVNGTLSDTGSNKLSYNDLSHLKANGIIENYNVLRNVRESEQNWGIVFETGSNFSQITNKKITLPFNMVEYSSNIDYNLLYGKLPNSNNEVIIDKLLVNYIFDETNMGFFMTSYRDITKSSIVLRGQNEIDNYPLTIVGVVDSGVPCVYASKEATVSFDGYSFNMHSYYLYENNLTIDYGRKLINEYEILLPYSDEYLTNENEFYTFSFLNESNGFEYTVVGLYSDIDSTKIHTTALTTNETLELSYLNLALSDFSVQFINTKQVESFEDLTSVSLTNIYNLEKDTYINEKLSKIKFLIYSILFIIITLFFIVLLLFQNKFKSIVYDVRLMRILGFRRFRIIFDFYLKYNLRYLIILFFTYSIFTLFFLGVNMILKDIITFYTFDLTIFALTMILFWIIEVLLYSIMSLSQIRKL